MQNKDEVRFELHADKYMKIGLKVSLYIYFPKRPTSKEYLQTLVDFLEDCGANVASLIIDGPDNIDKYH